VTRGESHHVRASICQKRRRRSTHTHTHTHWWNNSMEGAPTHTHTHTHTVDVMLLRRHRLTRRTHRPPTHLRSTLGDVGCDTPNSTNVERGVDFIKEVDSSGKHFLHGKDQRHSCTRESTPAQARRGGEKISGARGTNLQSLNTLVLPAVAFCPPLSARYSCQVRPGRHSSQHPSSNMLSSYTCRQHAVCSAHRDETPHKHRVGSTLPWNSGSHNRLWSGSEPSTPPEDVCLALRRARWRDGKSEQEERRARV
jgi:hypothetical protein